MMEVEPQKQYTILRIKRKRNEEPLDALVVESALRKKKSKAATDGINVFQFAQTVEHDAWEDEKRRQELQEQVSRIAQENARHVAVAATAGAAAATPVPAIPIAVDALKPKPASPSTSRQPNEDQTRRYTIVPQAQDDPEEMSSTRRKFPTSPPKVISHKDLPKKNDFRMYDAILAGNPQDMPTTPADEDMDNFMPMLTDYLKIHDMTPPGSPAVISSKSPISSSAATSVEQGGGDDYVWDIFYHRPTKLTEWNAIANIATLTGLPPSTSDPFNSDSDTEPEDEADEDSNEEEYYKNDYPEEEDSSDDNGDSDMFHEDSDDEGVAHEEEFDEHEWR